MFELQFKTTGQVVFIRINKEVKLLEINTQITDYKYERTPWSYLADKGIYWVTPPKKTQTGLKKIPMKIEQLQKKAILRRLHGLTKTSVELIKDKNETEWKRELKYIDTLTEQELKEHIIDHMLNVGYKYVGSK